MHRIGRQHCIWPVLITAFINIWLFYQCSIVTRNLPFPPSVLGFLVTSESDFEAISPSAAVDGRFLAFLAGIVVAKWIGGKLIISLVKVQRITVGIFAGPYQYIHLKTPESGRTVFVLLFFLFVFYGPSRLFLSFWAESFVKWDEKPPRKTTWPPAAELGLCRMVTRGRAIKSAED